MAVYVVAKRRFVGVLCLLLRRDRERRVGMSMRAFPRTWMWLVTALLAGSHANDASAQLSLFPTEMQARRRCPNDTVVWLDFRKGIYYVGGQRRYAQGLMGTFVCRKEAHTSGYRRSVFGRR
jgi:hypothetical protein